MGSLIKLFTHSTCSSMYYPVIQCTNVHVHVCIVFHTGKYLYLTDTVHAIGISKCPPFLYWKQSACYRFCCLNFFLKICIDMETFSADSSATCNILMRKNNFFQ